MKENAHKPERNSGSLRASHLRKLSSCPANVSASRCRGSNTPVPASAGYVCMLRARHLWLHIICTNHTHSAQTAHRIRKAVQTLASPSRILQPPTHPSGRHRQAANRQRISHLCDRPLNTNRPGCHHAVRLQTLQLQQSLKGEKRVRV